MPTESQLRAAALQADRAWPANGQPRQSRDENMRNDRHPSESRVSVSAGCPYPARHSTTI